MSRWICLLILVFGAACGNSDSSTDATPKLREALEARRAARIAEMASSATGAPNHHSRFSALSPSLDLAAVESNAVFNPNDEYWGLPRTLGVDAVSLYCSSCHSLQLVMQQRATPERWDYLLDWMTTEQGMAPLIAEDDALVRAYLNRHFGASRDP